MKITLSEKRKISREAMVELYQANGWSAAEKPEQLHKALLNAHSLITAWQGERLLGLGNAISDGHLVVYFPHLLVHPEYKGQGIGKMIMDRLRNIYQGFHMQMLTADSDAVGFYEKMSFRKAGKTQAMWIYQGEEHG